MSLPVLRRGRLGEDCVGVLGPGERSAALVPGVDVDADGGLQIRDGVKVPRRIAWRVMMPKKTSTRFIHDPEVGVKCSVIREMLGEPGPDRGCLWLA
jgi:hypothetical protein